MRRSAAAFALFALVCVAAAAPAAPRLQLFGYLCPSCPSATEPAKLIKNIHPAYTHVALAFVGWDATGALVNQWDAPDKGFTLTRAAVAALQV